VLQVCVIVIKNNVLGQIKWEEMNPEGNPEFGVELEPIDFALVATACGAKGFTIERPEDAEGILCEALAHKGPTAQVLDGHFFENEAFMRWNRSHNSSIVQSRVVSH
jgi:thiamine pyrophosphate-dependent acetolactate synthase large subunit-like protein